MTTVLRKTFLCLLVSAAVVTEASACSSSKPVAKTSKSTTTSAPKKKISRGEFEEEILAYTNKFRQSKGKPPLKLVDVISDEARDHSKDMANGRTGFGHEGFESRIDHVTKKMGRVAGAAENVAYGNLDAQGVVNGWINSPGHRKNMLGDYTMIGIGVAEGKNNITFFTQVFIKQ
ncbi:Cysteine-rich secretory protein family protein [Chitinophaga skermanii]|uniref:Cysteine-rich secretory protein family protein n=1 Tax=Chitinophaga skermanii TaxID=331697 RepID=A0A327QU12_9BACT|nr:CAP domain-containing protein [Chitinophaga skermanii]RAJ06893.1 Cysteine-rich secretory protein family protein [Chitinophaga skermanii]